jgi:protein O-GlcNAc transferase
VRLHPFYAEGWNNLGLVLREAGETAAALAAHRRALALRPTLAEAHLNLAIALRRTGATAEALAAAERARALRPDLAEAEALALTLRRLCADWSGADPDRVARLGVEGGAVPPFGLLMLEDAPDRQRQRSEAWVRARWRPLPSPPHPAPTPALPRPPGTRLRLGYFGADFRDHPSMHLMAGLLRSHDRDRVHVHVISYGPPGLHPAARSVETVHEVAHLPDAGIAALGRAQGLDVAVDLMGHTTLSRTRLFAHRPAPVQLGFLGYPGTTGAPFLDYLVADRIVIPPEARAQYGEALILMPHSYAPADDAREIGAPGRRADHGLPEGAFVYCCFNNLAKIGPAEFDIWMRLLARRDDAVLWLLDPGREAAARLGLEAAARGVAPDRLRFAPRLPVARHLARHVHADLVLDCFAYNAHTTASDALWAGLPVVTMAGRQFAARVAASLLTAAGLPELVTDSPAAYAACAAALTDDPARLSGLRARLAAQRHTAPLFDTRGYARDFEAALQAAHRRHIAGLPPADLEIPPGRPGADPPPGLRA